MSLNKVILIGYLGRDPEIRYTPSGLPVVRFSLATNDFHVDREGKRHQRTDWHRVMVAGKLALTCNKYLSKGQQAFVEGRLRTYEWERNGASGRRTEIVASRVQFLGTSPAEGTEANPTDDPALPARSDSDLDATSRDRLPGPWRLSERRADKLLVSRLAFGEAICATGLVSLLL